MLRKTLLIAVALIIALCAIATTRPDQYRVVRETTIAAPAPLIWTKVNDLRQWEAWSPWEKLDPAMKRSYAGPPAGPGQTYTWSGNRKAGAGTMTIIESKPLQRVRIDLEFTKPLKNIALTTITLTPAANGQTKVTWEMTGNEGFLEKIFFLFTSMDKMVGIDFDNGLTQLKTLCESKADR